MEDDFSIKTDLLGTQAGYQTMAPADSIVGGIMYVK